MIKQPDLRGSISKELDLRQCRRTTFDFARVGLVQQNHLSAGDLCSDENSVAARDHEHAIHKSGSGSCCFALCWIGSVHRAGLRDDAHSLRSSRAYSRTRHWARFKHLPQLSLITFGYEPATTCRTERKSQTPKISGRALVV